MRRRGSIGADVPGPRVRGATICRADCHQLPFPSDRFGGAFADRVVQHVARPARALEELVRVLRRADVSWSPILTRRR